MKVLALDIGEKRIGVASGNTDVRISCPVSVFTTGEVLDLAGPWKRILDEEEPDLLVIGLPKSLSGRRGPQAQRITKVANTISEQAGIPIEFIDERLSSAEAKQVMRAQGYSEKDMRGRLDAIAASLFLQTWLDKHKAEHA